MKTIKKTYELVRTKPVARFYYQGNHSHPIRRTVLIVEDTEDKITGYEFRCGNKVRSRREAMSKIRSYRKDKIATWGSYSRLTKSSKNFMKDPSESTLKRYSLVSMFTEGA